MISSYQVGRRIDTGQFEKGDSRLPAEKETVFFFVRGDTSAHRILTACSEVFGRNQVRVEFLSFCSTDFLGSQCAHCNEAIEDPEDLVVSFQGKSIGTTLHELCFRKWFVLCDKESLRPYRFAVPQTVFLHSSSSMESLLVNGRLVDDGIAVTILENIEFTSIRQASARADKASERAQLLGPEKNVGINLFLCPRCNAPKEIPFLDTEEKVHECTSCGARFEIIVRETKR